MLNVNFDILASDESKGQEKTYPIVDLGYFGQTFHLRAGSTEQRKIIKNISPGGS